MTYYNEQESQSKLIDPNNVQEYTVGEFDAHWTFNTNQFAIFSKDDGDFIDIAVVSRIHLQIFRILGQQLKEQEQDDVSLSKEINESQVDLNKFEGELIFDWEYQEYAISEPTDVKFSQNGLALVFKNSEPDLVCLFQRISSDTSFELSLKINFGVMDTCGRVQFCTRQGNNLLAIGFFEKKLVLQEPLQTYHVGFLKLESAPIIDLKSLCTKDIIKTEGQIRLNVELKDSRQPASFQVQGINCDASAAVISQNVEVLVTQISRLYLMVYNLQHNSTQKLRLFSDVDACQGLELNKDGTILAVAQNDPQIIQVYTRSASNKDFEAKVMISGYKRPIYQLQFAEFDSSLLVLVERYGRMHLTQMILEPDQNQLRAIVHQKVMMYDKQERDETNGSVTQRSIKRCFGLGTTSKGDICFQSTQSVFRWKGFVPGANIQADRLPVKFQEAMKVFENEVCKHYDLPSLIVKKIKNKALYPIGAWLQEEDTVAHVTSLDGAQVVTFSV
eukprot:TRINITY_DN11152_c0_g1_i17.p1 TRINITY_DN11152_c0_g1~~TRINITY_DN11152_c0_g1_i17.p1  ORF type:complete len:536 (-),score=52.34 TRINITY_DN11152_c0_g1_i17:1138-2643(-)